MTGTFTHAWAEPYATRGTKTVKVPLSVLLPQGRDTTLRGQWDKISFPLTILETQRANDIQITLSMTHSGQIDIANLWVSLGQKALATIQLQPNGAPQQVVISLTPELLARFGNILTIAVRHQLPNSLSLSEQRVEAAEAVTELLAEHSFFELSYTPTDAAPTLATAEALMRSGQMYNHAIQLVSLLPDTAPSDLTLAGMLVQGWTLRSGSDSYQYRFYSAERTPTAGNRSQIQLIYGLQDALRQHTNLPDDYLNAINGPYMALHHHQGHWQLILSGRNEQELLDAGRHFANPAQPLPQYSYGLISPQAVAQQPQVSSGSRYPVQLFTQQLHFGDEPLVLPLMMPANFLVNDGETSYVNLVLSHPKVTPGEAAMVLRVNGDYANSMPLRASYWRSKQHYRMNFPMTLLRPGLNNISIELYGPEQSHAMSQTGNIVPFTADIAATSAIQLGSWVNYLTQFEQQLPADQLLFITEKNGRDSQLTVDFAEDSELGDIWQLLSRLTLQAREPMTELLITDNDKQLRPFNLAFHVGTHSHSGTLGTMTTGNTATTTSNDLRQILLALMANSRHAEEEITAAQAQGFFQYPTSASPWSAGLSAEGFATLTTQKNGWRTINFSTANEASLQKEMAIYLSQPVQPTRGIIELTLPSREGDLQLLRAGFIAYPFSLPLLIFSLVLVLALILFRGLEKRA
ncbi:hypothetical protein ABT58_03130 [Photobacterium aphoticum]|uniref:Cyclic di-GMP-binding protein n=2 Tax=Photobacterium aphoticum TaxID=754436 RepID=A0A0J1GRZ8_9GAMM|nr:hypothetical protein ABT58_03130 [Photobacterium aphoticum]